MNRFLRILLGIVLFPFCLGLGVIAGIFVGIMTGVEAVTNLLTDIVYADFSTLD